MDYVATPVSIPLVHITVIVERDLRLLVDSCAEVCDCTHVHTCIMKHDELMWL